MIGLYNECFPPILDGVSLTVQNYAEWLNKKGQDVCVVTPYAPGPKLDTPYPIHYYPSLPFPTRHPYRCGLPDIDLGFVRQMRAIDWELIHAHGPFTAGHLGMRIARAKQVPLVATFHSKFRQDFKRSLKWDPLVDMMIQKVVDFFEKADEVWIPQASVEPTLREYGYRGHVEVMDNGNDMVMPAEQVRDLRDDMRRQLRIKNQETMMLFVGQMIWEKGIGLILDSLDSIRHLPWHFYLVGTGYATHEIQQRIRTMKLENKITMVGNVNDRQLLSRYYAAADLFLFPSLYDNAPLVVREAAALHTAPVMIQGASAAEGTIVDGRNGWLSKPGEAAYAATLSYLIDHPQERLAAGEQAAATMTRSWENVVDEVILRYRDIKESYRLKHRG